MNVWDLAAQWSARRWLRRLDTRLHAGVLAAEQDQAIATALARHVQVVRAHVMADAAARVGLVSAPDLVLLAIYASDLHREATRSGWEPPPVWTASDGVSLRLLACCALASRPRELARH
jgi:hypothetical protein